MNKHTPGPWYATSTSNNQGIVYHERTGENIAVTFEAKNAALIAAAPELLDALEDFDDYFACTGMPDKESALFDIVRTARAAIAKAKGE